jgi:hypothetical protein
MTYGDTVKFGQCARCGGSLTQDHQCPPWAQTVTEKMEESMGDKTDTDPAVVAAREITDDAFACPRPGDCNVREDDGGCEYCRMIWATDIIRTAYAETQAKADEREKRLVELIEEAYRDGYTEGGGATVRETDQWDRSPSKAKWESINMATNDDILSIVMDSLAGRSTADRTMDRISIRCEAIRTAYAQRDKAWAELVEELEDGVSPSDWQSQNTLNSIISEMRSLLHEKGE